MKKGNIFVDRLPEVWDIMEAIKERLKNVNRTDFPAHLTQGEATFDDIGTHGVLRQRLSLNTVKNNLKYMRFMETHDIPVDFRFPTYDNWLRHIDYREQIEFKNFKDGTGRGAIKHQWQAMRMVLKAYNIPIWDYKPPQPPDTVNKFPMPEQAYKIINHNWHKNPYINALIQYYLTFNFAIGWRPPSEPAYMKVSNVDFDRKMIKVVEPKKRYRERWIRVNELLSNKNIKSFWNWIHRWRPKVANEYSGDYLFLYPDGRPFWNENKDNGENLRMFVNRIIFPKIREFYPDYYPYCSRHFCAVANLLKTYDETKQTFDIYIVSRLLGHQKLSTTLSYVKDAELYVKDKPHSWFYRALKTSIKRCEENTVKNRQKAENGSIEESLSCKIERRLPLLKWFLEGNLISKIPKIGFIDFFKVGSISLKNVGRFCLVSQ